MTGFPVRQPGAAAPLRSPRSESEQARGFGKFCMERDIAKVSVYVTAALALLLCTGLFADNIWLRSQSHGLLVVRIDEIGRAQAMGYTSALAYRPQAPELKYFLMQFMRSYYGRNRATAREDFQRSLQFLLPTAAAERMARERTEKSVESFMAGMADQVDVSVENVILGELKAAPYTAQVDLWKVYRGHDGAEIRREKCVETVTFDLAKEVPNSMIETNPLGITITKLPVEDVAYTEGK